MNFFARLHPFVLLMYFVAVLSVSMFMQHPIYLTLSFLGGVGFLVFLKGIKYVIKSLATFVLLGLIITLTNPLFSHNGATPLFFINGNAFTLEALVYGGVFALLIICVIFWFSAFNQIFDSEKILFLFGRISPKRFLKACNIFNVKIWIVFNRGIIRKYNSYFIAFYCSKCLRQSPRNVT